VPLLLGFGAISSLLSAKFNRRMLKASGVLVAVLGLVMFTRGMSLFGVTLPSLQLQPGQTASIAVARLVDGIQEVRTTVESGAYHPLIVQKGSRALDHQREGGGPQRLQQPGHRPGVRDPQTAGAGGQPDRVHPHPGRDRRLHLLDGHDLQRHPGRAGPAEGRGQRPEGPAARTTSPRPSGPPPAPAAAAAAPPPRARGGKIPADRIEVAELTGEGQVAEVHGERPGLRPRGDRHEARREGKIRFVPEKLSSCNYLVSFPEYQGGLDLSKGRLETPYLEISQDFTFQCGMGMLHGYVKVVDDPSRVDLQAVRREVAAFKPASTGGCCGQ